MKLYTYQEVFNKVSEHLFKQGCQAVEMDSRACLYRGPNGLKCAIGALIPDELYDTRMEYGGIIAVCRCFPSIDRLFDGLSKEWLDKVQHIHDNILVWDSTAKMKDALRKVAKSCPVAKLDTSILDGLSFKDGR